MCSPELGKKSATKKLKNKTFEHYISPLCQGDPTGPIFTVFGVWSRTPDVINRTKFQVDCARRYGARGVQNRVFLIDFHHRPYNSVTQYGATL